MKEELLASLVILLIFLCLCLCMGAFKQLKATRNWSSFIKGSVDDKGVCVTRVLKSADMCLQDGGLNLNS